MGTGRLDPGERGSQGRPRGGGHRGSGGSRHGAGPGELGPGGSGAGRAHGVWPCSIGENIQLLVDRPDGTYCFRLHRDRVYYLR